MLNCSIYHTLSILLNEFNRCLHDCFFIIHAAPPVELYSACIMLNTVQKVKRLHQKALSYG